MTTETWIWEADAFFKNPSPSALNKWIKSLPTHEIGPLSSILPHMYNGLNALNINADQLHTYIDALRPVLHNVAQELSKTDLKSFESHEEAKAFSERYLKLLSVEAESWEAVLNKAMNEKDDASLHKAIHRLMAAQLCIHLAHYQFYLPMPAKEWLKLHKLFYLAVQRKQSSFTTADFSLFPGQRITIGNLYIIGLLLGCSRANKLAPADIKTVYELLKHWAELVTISRTPTQSGDNQLVVDIAAGAAPNFYKLFTATEKSIPCYLQIEPLIQRMDKILKPDSSSQFSALLIDNPEKNHALIAHLKSAWCEYLHREERTPTHQPAFVCIGLLNIHYYLSGNKTLADFIGLKSSLSIVYEQEDDVSTIITQRGTDVWSWTPSKAATDIEINSKDIPAEYNFQRHFDADFNLPNEDHPLFLVTITDTSTHGYRLEWSITKNNKLPIEVGELLGIKAEDSNHIKLGIVMWMDYTNNSTLHTGIKLISTLAFPVGIDVPLTATVRKNATQGILLPPQLEFNPRLSLLVEPNVFRQNEYTTISQKNIEEKIKFVDLIKTGSSYGLYECGFVVKK